MTERWEVRWYGNLVHSIHDSAKGCRKMLRLCNADNRTTGRCRLVHVRTYRVEVVYAWMHADSDVDDPETARWLAFDQQTWTRMKLHRAEFRDPLGKHSRKRAKKAALAAKPSGPCVLVAVRRRVKG